MTLKTKCPCGHVFTFDTEAVSFRTDRLLESTDAPPSKPAAYLPKCPKCKTQLTVPNPDKS